MDTKLSPSERNLWLDDVTRDILLGNLSKGGALKKFRHILGFSQDKYASIVNVSRKTISDIERDKEVSATVYNKVFKPMGLQLGLVPTNKTRWNNLF